MSVVDLSRFYPKHERYYDLALREIRSGVKRSCWMWYIFPQIQGLGISEMSVQYAINSKEEAAAFLADPCLGKHLVEISEALLQLKTNNPREVFKRDAMKLHSSMTLFLCVSDPYGVFQQVLDKFFGGRYDYKTLDILKAKEESK